MKEKILLGYRYFEHFIVLVLLGLLMAVVLYATIGLVVFIVITMAERSQLLCHCCMTYSPDS